MPQSSKAVPFFSVVVPSLNEAKYLPLLLKDLSKQSYQQFEVIHVDGQSEDATVAAANRFAKTIQIKTITTNQRNVSIQRNLGAKNASGIWVLYLDADTRIPHHFLEGLKYQLVKKPRTDLFTTWVELLPHTPVNLAMERSVNLGLEAYKLIGKAGAPGAMIGIKRCHTKKISFDHTQKILEDMRFIQSGIEHGLRFEIFRDPKYHFSLRRIQKEGMVKIAGMVAMTQLRYLSGGDFNQVNFGYVMQGGNYYEQIGHSPITNLSIFMKDAPRKQLFKLKSLLTSFKTLKLW